MIHMLDQGLGPTDMTTVALVTSKPSSAVVLRVVQGPSQKLGWRSWANLPPWWERWVFRPSGQEPCVL